jgi:hypothetical protein
VVGTDSHRISRVPCYLEISNRKSAPFRLPGFHRLWPVFPHCSTKIQICNSPACLHTDPFETPQPRPHNTCRFLRANRFGLFPVRSPLLGKSWLFSFPEGTKMFQFPSFASLRLWIHQRDVPALPGTGFPIRRSPG